MVGIVLAVSSGRVRLFIQGDSIMSSEGANENKRVVSRRNVVLASTTLATASALGTVTPLQLAQAQVAPSPATATIEGQVTCWRSPGCWLNCDFVGG
jgi:hypothetical protein